MNVIISRIFTKNKVCKILIAIINGMKIATQLMVTAVFVNFYDECIKHKGNKGNKTIGAIVKEEYSMFIYLS